MTDPIVGAAVRHRSARFCLFGLTAVAIGVAATSSCSTKTNTAPTPTIGQPAPLQARSTAALSSTCAADVAWLTSSTLPTEVPGDRSLCNFQQFMWQSMLALVQPTATPATLQFETWMPSYGVFIDSGTPTPWGQEPPVPCAAAASAAVPTAATPTAANKPPRFYSNIIKQAGSDQPLIDPSGQFVYYGMSVNQSEYTMLTSCDLYKSNCAGPLKPNNHGIDLIGKYPNLALPDTAVELKSSWMVLDETAANSGLYYVVPGWVQHASEPCKQVKLGLTGMHIVSKTPRFPALIWATFEHRNNAPDCSNTSASPPLGGSWNFYNPACTGCATNVYEPGKPAQVCRMHPDGDTSVGTFPGGSDCSVNPSQFACQPQTKQMQTESSASINSINQNVAQLIQGNPTLINPVWANYELVGNVWTLDQTLPPYLQAQVGSLSAANTSMETFVQNGVANVTNPYNCFSCHNMEGPTAGKNLPPVGLSHLFDEIQMAGGCESGALPASCAAYTH